MGGIPKFLVPNHNEMHGWGLKVSESESVRRRFFETVITDQSEWEVFLSKTDLKLSNILVENVTVDLSSDLAADISMFEFHNCDVNLALPDIQLKDGLFRNCKVEFQVGQGLMKRVTFDQCIISMFRFGGEVKKVRFTACRDEAGVAISPDGPD